MMMNFHYIESENDFNVITCPIWISFTDKFSMKKIFL